VRAATEGHTILAVAGGSQPAPQAQSRAERMLQNNAETIRKNNAVLEQTAIQFELWNPKPPPTASEHAAVDPAVADFRPARTLGEHFYLRDS
jgi:hypothetical protein